MSDDGDCRTAPATPGLLIIEGTELSLSKSVTVFYQDQIASYYSINHK